MRRSLRRGIGGYDVIRTIRKYQRAKNDEGASAVEYGLLVAAIAAVIVLVVFALGGIIRSVFSSTCTAISSGASVSGQSC